MWQGLSVCLSVCLSVLSVDDSKSYDRILIEFRGAVGHGPRRNWLDFGGDPAESCVYSGSQSRILYHQDVVHFAIIAILSRSEDRSKNQPVTFWWRSDSGCRSRVREVGSESYTLTAAVSSELCSLARWQRYSRAGLRCPCTNYLLKLHNVDCPRQRYFSN